MPMPAGLLVPAISRQTVTFAHAATKGWTPHRHWLYHRGFQTAVHTVMLIFERLLRVTSVLSFLSRGFLGPSFARMLPSDDTRGFLGPSLARMLPSDDTQPCGAGGMHGAPASCCISRVLAVSAFSEFISMLPSTQLQVQDPLQPLFLLCFFWVQEVGIADVSQCAPITRRNSTPKQARSRAETRTKLPPEQFLWCV